MKVVILVFALFAVALAAPYENTHPVSRNDVSKTAKILRWDSEQGFGPEGYKYLIETSDGIVKEEQGSLENAGTKEESLKVVGRYVYPGGPNGELITLEYVADKNGFQPIGAHIPQPVAPIH